MKLKFRREDIERMLAQIPKPDSDIMLVKDDGIYLMSFDQTKQNRYIAYACGYDPRLGDVWEKCRTAVGGDDFGEICGTKKQMIDILAESCGDIVVNITRTTIAVQYVAKKTTTATEIRP